MPDLAAALNRMAAAHGLSPFTEAEVARMVGDGVAALVARAFAARGAPMPEGAAAAFLAEYEPHAADATRPYPGIPEALGVLRDAGWRLTVCTNKPARAARALLDALGLAPLLDAVGGGDSYPVRKPDPAHLLATLAEAGGAPGAAVMAGDHANDVRAARGAGLPCIFASWGYGPPEMAAGADVVARSASELPGLARRLLRRGAPPEEAQPGAR